MSDFKKYKYQDSIPKSEKFRRLLWEIVYLLLFRITPRWTLDFWRISLLRLFGAKIGIGCRVSPSCRVWAPWNLEMGDYSVLGDNVDCYTMNKIKIGSKVAVSQRAFICCGSHDISSLTRPLITKPISIHDHAWVCSEAFIGPGVDIGKGGVVAAKAVVVHDVPDFTVVGGNPAVFIKKRVLKGDA